MKLFTVIGTSGSGKTTTIEAVVSELRQRGYRVGSVKEIHYEAFAIDPSPGSNTHRHRAAGAGLVTARGLYETDILYPGKLPMKDILWHYKDYDWVALEGVEDIYAPVIVCSADKSFENAICTAGKLGAEFPEYPGLPGFNPLEAAAALCDFLEAEVPDYLACWDPGEPESGVDITLTVDGQPIRMVPFVQKILRNALLGVAQELEGYREGARLEVLLK